MRHLKITSTLLFCLLTTLASADDISDAREAGLNILKSLEQGKNKSVWNDNVSDWFKQRMTRDAFLANMTTVQLQLGGAATQRRPVQQNRSQGNSQMGYNGPIYSFTFATSFPATNAYETIVVIRESGEYKLSGINWVPNPNE